MPMVVPAATVPLPASVLPVRPPAVKLEVFSGGPGSTPLPHNHGAVVRTGEFLATAVTGQAMPRATAALGSFETAQLQAAARASGAVETGGFADAPIAAATAVRATPRVTEASFSPVEILFKPRPAYTEEARRLRIEGEVVLEALFAGSGEIRVLRVIQSLGHGLDENAVEAARRIRFRPAQSDGDAIDSTATVHITFQITY